MLVLPIRTESVVRRPPNMNYALIGINFLCFFAFSEQFGGVAADAFKQRYFFLHAHAPAFHEFFTYQFMHASPMHIIGNMLFLWVFGNAVNSKMGDGTYFVFYLAGGVFAGWGYALTDTGGSVLLGASGAIAAITAAYLALFPRSRVTVLVWFFFFIHFFEWPAMILILLKIIVWDNIIGPAIMGAGNVAHTAHLAGYSFGFLAALMMLLVRALPRDQFDILALWSRWRRRREFAAVMSAPGAAEHARYGSVARVPPVDKARQKAEDKRLDELAEQRSQVMSLIEQDKLDQAIEAYTALVQLDDRQCLPERGQLVLARALYRQARYVDAAQAFERFVACYPRSPDALDVRLLLGIMYARDLHRAEEADRHLTDVLTRVTDESRRAQCLEWLKQVRSALGRPEPNAACGP